VSSRPDGTVGLSSLISPVLSNRGAFGWRGRLPFAK